MAGNDAGLVPENLTGRELPAQLGRYQVVSILGEGGMARVFRAELTGSGGFRKQCALKVIHKSVVGHGDQVRRLLLNEARLGGLLKHPNIVDTYDCGEIDGQPYIAMELVRGVGLDELIDEEGALPPAVAVGIAVQMCAALDHAHNLEEDDHPANLVHRDLKPSNVMLSRDGLVKLMDFGIAKANMLTGATTKTGMTKGTPQYMSPEQLQGKELDCRSDLFAVGAILYELFVGRRLFEAENLGGAVLKIVTADDSLGQAGVFEELEEIHGGLGELVRRCVRVAADQRFDSAMDLRRALRGLGVDAADSDELRAWVRERMAATGRSVTTTADVPSVAGAAASDPFGDTTPLEISTPEAAVVPATKLVPREEPAPAPSGPASPQTIGPTRPMPAQTKTPGLRLGALLGGLGVAAVLLGLFVLGGKQTPTTAPGAVDEAAAVGPETEASPAADPAEAGAGEAAAGDAADAPLEGVGESASASEPPPRPEPVEEAPTAAPSPEVAEEEGSAASPAREPIAEAPTPAPGPTLTLRAKSLPTRGLRNRSATFEVQVQGSPSAAAVVWYRPAGSPAWQQLPLTRGSGGVHTGQLSLTAAMGGTTIDYYVKATDGRSQKFLGSRSAPKQLTVR